MNIRRTRGCRFSSRPPHLILSLTPRPIFLGFASISSFHNSFDSPRRQLSQMRRLVLISLTSPIKLMFAATARTLFAIAI